MKLTVINGSPRGKNSNSKIILSWFIRGFIKNKENSFELFYLKNIDDRKTQQEIYWNADHLIIALPLYTDSMPAQVKAFFEHLEPFRGKKTNLKIGFLVQSGFPESCQSKYLEKYLEKLVRRMECIYLGTIIKGNVEGIQVKPLWMIKGFLKKIERIGQVFGERGVFDPVLINQLARPYQLNGLTLIFFKLIKRFGWMDMYWNKMLKKNHAFNRRNEKPYLSKG
ncbi:MAG: NAD(P)H-dependent oxidoreductase [Bacteroidales bacterium]|jgi:hypothetical protein|nr:NAD(P)H-dependent oxidoreductase [Bacteroidales bacterium]